MHLSRRLLPLFLPTRPLSTTTVTPTTTPKATATPIIKRKQTGDRDQTTPFVDRRVITVKAGSGGDGCISFSSLFANEFAGPDGGDGGSGGHVVFQATTSTKSLAHLTPIIAAKKGTPGRSRNMTGADAPHLIVPVPLGTTFKKLSLQKTTPSEEEQDTHPQQEPSQSPPEEHSNETSKSTPILADLNTPSSLFLAARGGSGGKGNKFFATPQNQSPEICEYGGEGETAKLLIEMAVIADFGLVGYPNAGKSTLLRAVSRARPKVASYAFTTLKPHVGVVFFEEDYSHQSDSTDLDRVTNIPGLLPDAHKNHGLGVDFLRHISRCIGLIYVIDFTDKDPVEQYNNLHYELAQYDSSLVSKKSLIVANKLDTPEAQLNFKKTEAHFPIKPLGISGKFGQNLKVFLQSLKSIVDERVGNNDKKEVIYDPVASVGVQRDEVRRWR